MGDVTLGEDASIWYGRRAAGRHGSDRHRRSIQYPGRYRRPRGRWRALHRGQSGSGLGHRVILHGCTVGDDCLIAMGSVLLNGVTIGSGSVVAAGAVVPEGMQVPPGSLVMGVPGRIVRQVDAALAERIAATWRHYVKEARAHKAGIRAVMPAPFASSATNSPYQSTCPHSPVIFVM